VCHRVSRFSSYLLWYELDILLYKGMCSRVKYSDRGERESEWTAEWVN